MRDPHRPHFVAGHSLHAFLRAFLPLLLPLLPLGVFLDCSRPGWLKEGAGREAPSKRNSIECRKEAASSAAASGTTIWNVWEGIEDTQPDSLATATATATVITPTPVHPVQPQPSPSPRPHLISTQFPRMHACHAHGRLHYIVHYSGVSSSVHAMYV